MKLKCIVVDDEAGARSVLDNYISRLDYLELSVMFGNAIEAFQYTKNNHVDIIFLDINMPEVNGFALLDMLVAKPCVIFTTAYSDYALRAFDYHAIDYLHKPIRFERFVMAVEKAAKWHSLKKEDEQTFIILKTEGMAQRIFLQDILYIESMGNYLRVITPDKGFVVHMTMHEMEQSLPQARFARIHKSYIINSAAIDSVGDEQVVVNNITLPVGKTYKKYFNAFVKEHKR